MPGLRKVIAVVDDELSMRKAIDRLLTGSTRKSHDVRFSIANGGKAVVTAVTLRA
jgi:FixJ family two-component response regulator